MASWRYTEGSNVPTVIIEKMQKGEPFTVEKTATDHIVPDTVRGLDDNGFTDYQPRRTSRLHSRQRQRRATSLERTYGIF